MVVGGSEQYKIMITNNKVKMLTKTEVYNKMDDNSKRMMDLLDEFGKHLKNHILPLYQPGGIYHVPTKHKGLRVDNVVDLEEKGQNVN